MYKSLLKIFKTKQEPTFSTSIQRVPSTQVSLDTSNFDYVSGFNAYEGFESLDNSLGVISESISSIDIPDLTLLQDTSGSWNSTYTTVCANSATWDSTDDVTYLSSQIDYLSGQIDSVYVPVSVSELLNDTGYITGVDLTEIETASGSWNSTYTTVCAMSAEWDSTSHFIYLSSQIDNIEIPDLTLVQDSSGNWNSTYTTVCANSATWDSTDDVTYLSAQIDNIAMPDLTLLQDTSGSWDTTYTTVKLNSADNWDNTGLSGRMQTIEASSVYFDTEIDNLYTLNSEVSSNFILHIDDKQNPHETGLSNLNDYNADNNEIKNIRSLILNPNNVTPQEGKLAYDEDLQTLKFYDEDLNRILIGQNLIFKGKNTEGSTIVRGQAIYTDGSTGDMSNVKLASADNGTKPCCVGLVLNESIINNSTGKFVSHGRLCGFNTSMFSVGDDVYLSTTPGGLTTTPPSYPNKRIKVGTIIRSHSNQGAIRVSIEDRTKCSWDEITGDQSEINLSDFTNDAGFITGVDLTGYAQLSADNDFTGNNTFKAVSADSVQVGGGEDLDVMVFEGWSDGVDGTYTRTSETSWDRVVPGAYITEIEPLEWSLVGLGDTIYFTTDFQSYNDPLYALDWNSTSYGKTGTITAGKKESLTFTPSGILDTNDEEIYLRDIDLTGYAQLSSENTFVEKNTFSNPYVVIVDGMSELDGPYVWDESIERWVHEPTGSYIAIDPAGSDENDTQYFFRDEVNDAGLVPATVPAGSGPEDVNWSGFGFSVYVSETIIDGGYTTITGDICATRFFGDGSGLSGVDGSKWEEISSDTITTKDNRMVYLEQHGSDYKLVVNGSNLGSVRNIMSNIETSNLGVYAGLSLRNCLKFEGTVSIENGSPNVIGVGTNFTKFETGRDVVIGNNTYEIDTITSDTEMTITPNASETLNDVVMHLSLTRVGLEWLDPSDIQLGELYTQYEAADDMGHIILRNKSENGDIRFVNNQDGSEDFYALLLKGHNGRLGIGVGNNPLAKLHVGGGIRAQSDIDVRGSDNGIILESPNGNRFRVQVDDSGSLTTEQV